MPGEIDPATLHSLIQGEEPIRVVDIRSETAFAHGHIPGSENIPFDELTEAIEEFDGTSRVVTVCPHGEASIQAARLIESFEGVPAGTRVESLAGGLAAWDGHLAESEPEKDQRQNGDSWKD